MSLNNRLSTCISYHFDFKRNQDIAHNILIGSVRTDIDL